MLYRKYSSREAFSRLIVHPSRFSYETITELDAKFRQVLKEVSAALPAEGATTRPQQWKRLVCLEGVHSRLVRLHRPFLLKKEASRKSCLESAEIVIKSQLQVQRWTNNVRLGLPFLFFSSTSLTRLRSSDLVCLRSFACGGDCSLCRPFRVSRTHRLVVQ